MKPGNISVVIPAAGVSRRMQTLKAFLPFDQQTVFIEKIISCYAGWGCPEIVIVLNPESALKIAGIDATPDATPGRVTIVINDHLEYERFYSVKLGLQKLKDPDYCFIQNIDNPFIDAKILDTLYQARNPDHYVSPVYDGKGGHPVLLSRANIDFIKEYPDNAANLKEILGAMKCKKVNMEDGRVLINMNTPEEYESYMDLKLV